MMTGCIKKKHIFAVCKKHIITLKIATNTKKDGKIYRNQMGPGIKQIAILLYEKLEKTL